MSKANDPAFPTPNDGNVAGEPGLTKLEWFAAQASEKDIDAFSPTPMQAPNARVQRIEARFRFAEAMLAESEKRSK